MALRQGFKPLPATEWYATKVKLAGGKSMSIWQLVLMAVGVVGGFCTIFGSIYGAAFRFLSKRISGTQATWSSSLWSGVTGTFLFLVVSLGMVQVVLAVRGALDPSPMSPLFIPYLLAGVYGPAILVQMLLTSRMLRRPDDTRFGFKNAAMLVAIPAVLMGTVFALTYKPAVY